jgi:Leucine-rich repeat (LRR) protein
VALPRRKLIKTLLDCVIQGITCNAQAKVIGIYIEATCKGCGPNGQFLIAKNTNNFGRSLATLRPSLKSLALINVQVQLKFPIPPTFFTLTNLDYLNLESCEFIGSIPKELSNLVNLEELRINGNKFSGGMPDSIGKLQKLKANQAPTLGSSQVTLLKKLTWFDYQRNKVTGPLPKWLGGLTVGSLDLDGNQFSGPIPPEICKIKGLGDLRLRGNKLSGPIPGCIGNLGLMEFLDVGPRICWPVGCQGSLGSWQS